MIQTPIIWNITNKCPYTCSFCCLDANSSTKDLSLEDKLKVIEKLYSKSIKIDFSGGEPLWNLENIEILKVLSEKFGREMISVTSTGKGLERVDLEELAKYVSEAGFTYDFPRESFPDRPVWYNKHNLELAKEVSERGIETMAQTPLIKSNIAPEIIEEIHLNLNQSKIDRLLLMRFSESGRGISRVDLSLNQREINNSLKIYKNLETKYEKPKIKITPSIKGELVGKIFTSLNISNQGLLLSNPWSYNSKGKPEEYCILGDLIKDRLSRIAGTNVYQRFFTQLRRNVLK
jgi:MoaA/NifB/PqqE/SkfB family radical SAM enzyme